MSPNVKKYLLAAAAVLVLLAGGAVTITTTGDSGSQPPTATATATPTASSLKLPPGASTVAPDGSRSDLADNLRAEPPVNGKAAGAAKTQELAQHLAPRAPPERIGPNCQVDYSGHVYSDRVVARPTEFVLHYTVSSNRPGWSDVLAIRDFFERTRLASAHFIVDFEGHCLKMVPLTKKAWTQGNANSWATSVEVIATGNESAAQWKAAPLFKQKILAGLVRRVMDYQGLPLVRVDPVGCVFVPGLTDHNHLECGNDHHDVAPHFPFRVFMRQLRTVR